LSPNEFHRDIYKRNPFENMIFRFLKLKNHINLLTTTSN